MHLSSASPRRGRGGDYGLMWGLNRFQSHCISPLGKFSLNYSLFGKAKHLTGFKMPFSTLTQFATFHTSIFARCSVSLTNKDKYIWIGEMNIIEELFESVLHSCSLITFNSDFHKNLGTLNVVRCRNVSIPFPPYSPCSRYFFPSLD